MLQRVIIFLVLYVVTVPLLIYFFPMIKTQIKQAIFGRGSRSRINAEPEMTLHQKIKRFKRYTIKEDTEKTISIPKTKIVISPKQGYQLILLFGLIVTLILAVFRVFLYASLFLLFPSVALIFSYMTSKTVLKARDEVMKRVMTTKSENMGLVEGRASGNYSAEFEILEWMDNRTSPKKIRLYLPTRFDILQQESFLEKWSPIFGRDNARWVGDIKDPDVPGFQFERGVATIKMMEPLPKRADWSAHYLLDDNVAWSFFPMALGAENGVPVTNPETGAEERVLGFDLSGDQVSLANKKGFQIGSEIVAAPQVLVAGGTGGGKALALDTKIKVLK